MTAEAQRNDDGDAKSSDSRRRIGLLALGSAAVLSIYTAGFVRTRAAAQRVAQSEAARHPSVERTRAPASVSPAVARSVAPTPKASAHADAVVVPALRAPALEKPVATAPSRQSADSVTTVVASVEAPPPAPATESAPVAPSVQSQASAASEPPTPPSQVQYKDGSYAGWGTSRHGDIEATIEIKGGRIVSAEITDCRTRYSCSRIAALPPQVLAKQSADVDYVSGATQSSDAYYYAVVEALKKAK